MAGSDGVELGWRMYVHKPDSPLIVHFHGNAEVAADYDVEYERFHALGCSLLAVDFRGYGWSKGAAKLTTLATDSEAVVAALPAIRERCGVSPDAPALLFGRSIGSVCAVHLAATAPAAFSGVVLESAVASILELPMVQQIAAMMPDIAAMVRSLGDPFGNAEKVRGVALPLLVLHGDRDEISPLSQGQQLFDAAGTPAAKKRMVTLRGAGHNDLTLVKGDEYFAALGSFVREATGGAGGSDAGAEASGGAGAGGGAAAGVASADDVASMSVKEMKAVLKERGVDFAGVVEKSEMRALVVKTLFPDRAEL